MKYQHNQSVEKLEDVISRRGSCQVQRNLESGDQEWIILKSQFRGTINSFMERLEKTELDLQQQIQKSLRLDIRVKEKEKQRVIVVNQLQRLKLLLPVKEQLLRKQRNEVMKLKNKIKMLQNDHQQQRGDKMHISKRRLHDLSPIPNQSLSQFNLAESQSLNRRKLSQDRVKSQYQNNHHSDLEIAKLKNENNKLQTAIKNLSRQIQMLKIQNQHVEVDCKNAINRERMLTSQLERQLLKGGKQNEVQSWNKKCQQIDSFVDNFPNKNKLAIRPAWINKDYSTRQPHHPPTPSFSSTFCGFGKKNKLASTGQAFFPLKEQISLGQIESILPESYPPSI